MTKETLIRATELSQRTYELEQIVAALEKGDRFIDIAIAVNLTNEAQGGVFHTAISVFKNDVRKRADKVIEENKRLLESL